MIYRCYPVLIITINLVVVHLAVFRRNTRLLGMITIVDSLNLRFFFFSPVDSPMGEVRISNEVLFARDVLYVCEFIRR